MSDGLSFTIEQDKNNNGIIDDDELTEEQKEIKKKHKCGQKDLLLTFYFVYGFTVLFLFIKFGAFFLFNISINLDMSKLALALNVFIVIVGIAEGIRSISSTITSDAGTRVPVPMYKLKILFGYLVSFGILTLTAVMFEIIIKIYCGKNADITLPDFNANEFLDGLVSNTVAYLIARFGDKITKNVDLSSFKLFKK
jgi:hypothetical protein